MTDILKEINERRLNDVALKTLLQEELQAKHRDRSDFRSFREALRQKMLSAKTAAIIAEIKRGSPAKGLFAPALEPSQVAQEYAPHAACLSVLTETRYFFGSLDDLIIARKSCTLPVLQKDFILTEYQVWESALYADAMLLIARSLEKQQLADLHGLATELGLDVLVEIFDEEDIDKIEPLHFPLVGINHRNLRTMSIDLENSQKWFARFTEDQMVVAASGIKNRHDIESLMQLGIKAFLVGECLSTHTNRSQFLCEIVEGTK